MNIFYQELFVIVTSEKYIYKNIFIYSFKVTFLRCQEYRSTDFVDGENIL